ncbi:MAG: hypothetical protein ACTSVI_06570 [Promethearchaeota archaeon]
MTRFSLTRQKKVNFSLFLMFLSFSILGLANVNGIMLSDGNIQSSTDPFIDNYSFESAALITPGFYNNCVVRESQPEYYNLSITSGNFVKITLQRYNGTNYIDSVFFDNERSFLSSKSKSISNSGLFYRFANASGQDMITISITVNGVNSSITEYVLFSMNVEILSINATPVQNWGVDIGENVVWTTGANLELNFPDSVWAAIDNGFYNFTKEEYYYKGISPSSEGPPPNLTIDSKKIYNDLKAILPNSWHVKMNILNINFSLEEDDIPSDVISANLTIKENNASTYLPFDEYMNTYLTTLNDTIGNLSYVFFPYYYYYYYYYSKGIQKSISPAAASSCKGYFFPPGMLSNFTVEYWAQDAFREFVDPFIDVSSLYNVKPFIPTDYSIKNDWFVPEIEILALDQEFVDTYGTFDNMSKELSFSMSVDDKSLTARWDLLKANFPEEKEEKYVNGTYKTYYYDYFTDMLEMLEAISGGTFNLTKFVITTELRYNNQGFLSKEDGLVQISGMFSYEDSDPEPFSIEVEIKSLLGELPELNYGASGLFGDIPGFPVEFILAFSMIGLVLVMLKKNGWKKEVPK